MEYLIVYEEDSQVLVVTGDEPQIDAALTSYLETGRDSLLHLTTVSGEPYKVRASHIMAWMQSTPESRSRRAELEKAGRDEETINRSTYGLPWVDE